MYPVRAYKEIHCFNRSLSIKYNVLKCSLEGDRNAGWTFCNLEKASSSYCYPTFKIVIFCPLKLITQYFCNSLMLLRLHENLKGKIVVYKAEKNPGIDWKLVSSNCQGIQTSCSVSLRWGRNVNQLPICNGKKKKIKGMTDDNPQLLISPRALS